MEKPVLIASATADEASYGPVGDILANKGYPVVIYKTDKLLTGEDQFTLDIDEIGNVTIRYNNISILPQDICAAWLRKIASFGLPDADTQLAKQLYMNNEVRALHGTIWSSFYPDDIWLSSPNNLARADRKLSQLLAASEVGFTIPETMVSSDWNAISDTFLKDQDDRIVLKMMRGIISDHDQLKSLYTTILDGDRVTALEGYTSPFPGLYQPYIPKAREWRVTVVGDDVFAAAIYTDEHAKDDWRKHQTTSAVQFRNEKLPDAVDELCIRYLGKMCLGYGAFDLIEKPDEEIVFLECNPNGEYFWLEQSLGLPISEAIAAQLIKIAERRS